MKNLILLTAIFIFSSYSSNCNDGSYKSIKKALKNKEHVFELDLSERNLEQLNIDFTGFKNLKILNVLGNNLNELPKSIKNLGSLEELYLDMNNFETFPKKVYNLKNLKILRINNNQITSIPDDISKLSHLTELWIFNNNLTNEEKEKIIKLLPNVRVKTKYFT